MASQQLSVAEAWDTWNRTLTFPSCGCGLVLWHSDSLTVSTEFMHL
jgi:hypothetical protein